MPATRDRLLPDVSDGMADVAIGNLTVTDERQKLVDFVPGDDGRRVINEIVVTGPKSPELKTLDDLAGKRVHVRKASSYFESLEEQNKRLEAAGKAAIQLIAVSDSLEDEDLMEMLNVGLVELLVVDDWKARMWSPVLPRVTVRSDLVLRSDARTGWAIRKDSPQLAAEIDDFFRNWAMKQGVAAYRMNTYMGYNARTAVLASTTLQVGGVIGAFGLAWLIARRGFIVTLASSFAIAALAIFAIGQPGLSLAVLVVLIFVAGWCVVGGQGGLNALEATFYPTDLRATGIGWALGVGRAGAIVGPYVGGTLLAGQWTTQQLFMAAAVPAVVSAMTMIALRFVIRNS